MKKIILSLMAIALLLGSCSKSSSVTDPFEEYVSFYAITNVHNNTAMDPFNVAYRLNVYLNNPGQQDQILKELFQNAEITTSDNQTYTVAYKLSNTIPTNDILRKGKYVINTYGGTLSDENAIWEIVTDQTDSLQVDGFGYGIMEMVLEKGDYQIQSLTSESWKINANDVYVKLAGTGYYVGRWSLDLTVSQVKGDQTPSGLNDAQFQITSNSETGNGGRNVFQGHTRYQILSPVLYSATCNFLSKSGGKERLISMDNYEWIGQDTAVYDFGEQFICDPSYSITAKIDSVWTTQYY